VRCFYHPDYTFPLPAEHPFPMDKFWRAEALIRAAWRFSTVESAGKRSISKIRPCMQATASYRHSTSIDKLASIHAQSAWSMREFQSHPRGNSSFTKHPYSGE
jgi:hypothetical protein